MLLFNWQCHQSLLSLMFRLKDPSRHSEHLSEIRQEHLPGRGGRLIAGRKGNTQGVQASGRCVSTHLDFQRAQKLSSSSPCVSCISNSVSSFETYLGFEISSLVLSIIWICVCLCVPMHICVCSCVCVCTCMYLCTYLPLCTCVWACVQCTHTWVLECMCVHMFILLCMCLHMWILIYMCVHNVCAYVYVCSHMCMLVCMHVLTSLQVCSHVYVCTHVCLYVHIPMYAWSCVCMNIYVCIYVCMSFCAYVCAVEWCPPGMTYPLLSWAAGSSDYPQDTCTGLGPLTSFMEVGEGLIGPCLLPNDVWTVNGCLERKIQCSCL